jgi:hypothetical protein
MPDRNAAQMIGEEGSFDPKEICSFRLRAAGTIIVRPAPTAWPTSCGHSAETVTAARPNSTALVVAASLKRRKCAFPSVLARASWLLLELPCPGRMQACANSPRLAHRCSARNLSPDNAGCRANLATGPEITQGTHTGPQKEQQCVGVVPAEQRPRIPSDATTNTGPEVSRPSVPSVRRFEDDCMSRG